MLTPADPNSLARARQAEKNAKARLVAGILLNRVHVQRAPGMRRRPVFGEAKREYRPSGLRCVVSCEP
jgi:4'-phosphopantetheinyl transferase EntD